MEGCEDMVWGMGMTGFYKGEDNGERQKEGKG